MKQNNVVRFPEQPIELDRVCLHRDEPCIIMVLPMLRVERLEPASNWVRRLLDGARQISNSPPSSST